MARPLRIEYSGAVYHITSRGNARKPIFKDDQDRHNFLAVLKLVNERYHWFCHAYCLMDNHYHLIIETPEGNLSQGMRQLNGVYTQTFNKRHHRIGHIFQGRYKAILIQKESHLLEVSRYVVLNPVRARAVQSLEGWRWSSYHGTAGSGKSHACLTSDWILGQLATRRGQAQAKYREFVKAGIGGEPFWNKVKAQSILGKDDFVDRLTGYVKGYEDIKEIPKSQRYIGRPGIDELFTTRVLQDKQKRNQRMKEAVMNYGYSQKEIADHLGMHYSTVSKLIKMPKSKT